MTLREGFLLIEFIISLFLLSLCITFLILQYAHIGLFITESRYTHERIMIMQSAIEKARSLKKEYYELYNKGIYDVETAVNRDHTIKNFLHIIVSIYDKDKKKETWCSGVTVPNE